MNSNDLKCIEGFFVVKFIGRILASCLSGAIIIIIFNYSRVSWSSALGFYWIVEEEQSYHTIRSSQMRISHFHCYFLGFSDWGTASLTLPGRLRPTSWSLRLLMRSRSRLVASLSAMNIDTAVLDALPLLLWPGRIFTLYLLVFQHIFLRYSQVLSTQRLIFLKI